jgi:hypothetical protein
VQEAILACGQKIVIPIPPKNNLKKRKIKENNFHVEDLLL